jgi:hypothetical protein
VGQDLKPIKEFIAWKDAMIRVKSEDFGEIESMGHFIPIPDYIITGIMGIFLFLLYLLVVTGGEIGSVFEVVYFWILAILIFLFLLLRSIFIAKRFYFKVYKDGVLYREGERKMRFMPWTRIRSIRTNYTTLPTFKSSFVEISDGWRIIVFNEYLPKNTSHYYYAVALLYMYSTIYRIPFNDNADLLYNQYVREMGFIYPNLVHHGKYFLRKLTREQLRRKVINCPNCKKRVIPMKMGRCPSCGSMVFQPVPRTP